MDILFGFKILAGWFLVMVNIFLIRALVELTIKRIIDHKHLCTLAENLQKRNFSLSTTEDEIENRR